jgi:hypothetical protein
MTGCPILKGCLFFNRDCPSGSAGTEEDLKRMYCFGAFSVCARYQVYEKYGRPAVPADLLPNAQDRLENILSVLEKGIA